MSDGIGCVCWSRSTSDCVCDVNWNQKPLSDEEIFNLCPYIDHDMLEEAFYRGARAIEKHHGIEETLC